MKVSQKQRTKAVSCTVGAASAAPELNNLICGVIDMDVKVSRKQSSQYKGVTKKGNKWAAQVSCGGGKVLYVGVYSKEIDAAEAAEKARSNISLEQNPNDRKEHASNKLTDGQIAEALETFTGIPDGWMCKGCGLISKEKPKDCPKCTGGGWDTVCMSGKDDDICTKEIFKTS